LTINLPGRVLPQDNDQGSAAAMRRREVGYLTAGLAMSVAMPAVIGRAADIQERTLRLSTAGNKGSPHVIGAQKFADLVAEKSGGQITVKIYPGGVLGPDLQNYSAMQGGTLDFNISNASYLAGNVKEMAVFDFPFLFNTVEEVDAVADGPVGKKLLAKLPERGLVGLVYTDLGFRHFNTQRRPVAKAEDVAGLKMRVIPTPIYVEVMNALGANAVPMPYTEVYSALETGAVDGMTNTLVNIIDMKFYEVAKHVTLTNHMYNAQVLIMSKKTWDKLSEEERRIVEEAGAEMAPYQRKASRDLSAKAMEQLKAEGVEVVELPAAEIAIMREKVQPVVEKFTASVGPELVAELRAEIEKVRGKS
jgi:tripartite ATP-independent transporter DctP family solute receptor